MFLWWPSTKSWFVKNMAASGAGLFYPLYLYRKLFKKSSQNHWTDFNITWQQCSFDDPLPRLFKPSWCVKNMAARGRGFFSLYIYIKKIFLPETTVYSSDFNITWQEDFLGDPLPRLFRPSWFVEKHGLQGGGGGGGGGLISPIYLYRKL